MPFYESVFISRQDVSAAQVEGLTEQFSKLIEDSGGKVTKKEYWGLRNLAYRIKKNRKGHYTLLNIDASAEAVTEMERNMRINEDVIRYLTVRVDELEEEPSIIMRSKGSRDDRGRDGRRWGGGFRGGGRHDGGHRGGGRPGGDRHGGDRPGSDRSGSDRSGGDRPGADRPEGERPRAEAAADKPEGGKE